MKKINSLHIIKNFKAITGNMQTMKRNQTTHSVPFILKGFLAIFFLVTFTTLSLHAQSGRVKGKVVDAKSNLGLEFANVVIDGTNLGTITDINGDFFLEDVSPGFYRLLVSSVGYETTYSQEIQVQGNQTTDVKVAVQESALMVGEVVVRQKPNIKKIESPLSVTTLGVQEIEKSAGVNRDISKLIQTLPGVGITDPNRNDLIVRGGGPSENVFYLDGVEIPVINHFTTQGASGGSVGIINPDFVSDVSFYTGAFPANRVNALSSVMEIRQRDGSRDAYKAKVAVGASDAALTLEGPVGENASFIASARQSYLQFLFSAIGLPFLPTYTDFQFKYKVDLSKKSQLTILGLGAIDDMVLNTGLENPDEGQQYILNYLPVYKQWNYTIGAVYKYFQGDYYDTWVLSRNMFRNANYKHLNNDESLMRISDYLSDEIENKFRFERTYLGSRYRINWGAGGKFSKYSNETFRLFFQDNEVLPLNYNTALDLFFYNAFFQISDKDLIDGLQLSFGVNIAGNNYNEPMRNPLNQLSPRLSATYSLTETLNWNANIGRYAMAPSYTTLGFRNTMNQLVNQTEALKYVISNQAIMGFEYLPKEKLSFTVEGFYKHYDNYPLSVVEGISLASKGTDFGQVGDEAVVSDGFGRAYGVEFLFKALDYNNFNATVTYTLFRSEFSDVNDQLRSSSWDNRQLVNLIASYRTPGSWNFAARWRYLGGRPYSPIDMDLSTLAASWDIRNQAYVDYDNYNALRLPSTNQLDIRIDKEFYFKKFVLNLYVDVQNVLNKKTASTPIYTNLDENGEVMIDPENPERYQLRTIQNLGGTVLPTLGFSLKI